ncbi:MAG: flagellar hook capping FlgD N-terminal domain-containing protein [Bacillota bacterium]|nr:flagellar hook capping FlgD N-terminal domain-containing protein [Bacillota bacterium]
MSTTYGVSGTGTSVAASVPARQPGDVDKQQFLKLLVTQLSMQDPLKPMTDHAYIAQLAQFSSLEQMSQMNSEMSALRMSLENGQMRQTALGALSLLGAQATVRGTGDRSLTGTIEAVKLLGTTILLRMAGEEFTLDQLQEVTRQ